MSLLYRSTCGDNSTAAESGTIFGWTPAIGVVTTGRVAGNCYKQNNNTSVVALDTAGSAETTHHFAFKVDNLVNQQDFYALKEGATTHVTLRLNTNGSLSFTRNGTVLWTSTAINLVVPVTWIHFQVRVKISSTIGECELRINGGSAEAGTYVTGTSTTQNTKNGGVGICDGIQLFGNGGSNTYFDDIHVWDGNAFKGDTRVIGQVVNAAGALNQFTPNASTNISRVSEATQDGDTTYNSDTGSGNRDTFGLPTLGVGTGATIYAACAYIYSRKDDAAARTVGVTWRIGGVNYDGAAQTLSTSYAPRKRQDETSPATAAAWTLAEVNGAELGYKD